jgi:ElaB/YqjD/DUF883 family membrane-anchored ribosome-binding protein
MDNYGNSTSAAATQASDQALRTANAAAEAVEGARRTASAAIEAGRAYAAGAVNAAGRSFDEAKGHVNRLTDQTSRYVVDQPMRAVGIAAAAGFLAAVLLHGMRSR